MKKQYTITKEGKVVVYKDNIEKTLLFKTLKEAGRYLRATQGKLLQNTTENCYPNYQRIEDLKKEYIKYSEYKSKHIEELKMYTQILGIERESPITKKIDELNSKMFELLYNSRKTQQTIFKIKLKHLYNSKKEDIYNYRETELKKYFNQTIVPQTTTLLNKEEKNIFIKETEYLESELNQDIAEYNRILREKREIRNFLEKKLEYKFRDYIKYQQLTNILEGIFLDMTSQIKYNKYIFNEYNLEEVKLKDFQAKDLVFDKNGNSNFLYKADNTFVYCYTLFFKNGFPYLIGHDGKTITGEDTVILLDKNFKGEYKKFPNIGKVFTGPASYKELIKHEIKKL